MQQRVFAVLKKEEKRETAVKYDADVLVYEGG
jgi:hypothetical protein